MSEILGNNQNIVRKPIVNDKILTFQRKLPTDRIVCKICRTTYRRSGLTRHRRTRKHIMYVEMHERFGNVLFNQPFNPTPST